jgi:uncharacterized membrane protein
LRKNLSATISGIIFILAGINHLIMSDFYLQIMPSYLPFPIALVYLSGFSEMVCGALLIPQKTRKWGVWLTIALLLAVFPANLQLSFNEYENGGLLFYVSLIRLPLQFLLIYWVYRLRM